LKEDTMDGLGLMPDVTATKASGAAVRHMQNANQAWPRRTVETRQRDRMPRHRSPIAASLYGSFTITLATLMKADFTLLMEGAVSAGESVKMRATGSKPKGRTGRVQREAAT
jgi:hypothetical protein